jgi:hypothetical protein
MRVAAYNADAAEIKFPNMKASYKKEGFGVDAGHVYEISPA